MNDNNTWLEYTKNIKKIKSYKKKVTPPKPTLTQSLDLYSKDPQAIFIGKHRQDTLQNSYRPLKIGNNIISTCNTSSRIDLHGLTQDQAFDTLKNFLKNAHNHYKKELLIITGKGQPDEPGVIKLAVPRWLQYTELKEYVLSYSIAKKKLGGEGAISITLKRNKGDFKYD